MAVSKVPKSADDTHKQVSVAEFFEKNRHLLGFNNAAKSLLTSVKEAVDNSLDACEDNKILPDITVQISEVKHGRFKLIVEDNGPGIDKKHLLSAFGKLLYGSKFQTTGGKQGRGQQGIGISSVILYGQLTSGKPAVLISKTKKDAQAHMYVMGIDVKKNEPEIVSDEPFDWSEKESGIRIAVEMEAKYVEHKQSVLEYIKQTAIVNPHAKITYVSPSNEKLFFPRVTDVLPLKSKVIKPHPHGVELGVLKRMLKATNARTIKSFFTKEFDKVGGGAADQIIQIANGALEDENKKLPEGKKLGEINPQYSPKLITPDQVEKLLLGMQNAKISRPSLDCLSPIGGALLKKSLESEFDLEFVHTITRGATVYRGSPFQIEVGIGYGGELDKEGSVKLVRFANKVPLLYQEGACALTQSVKKMNWKPYGLSQSSGSFPTGPAIIVIHMASVWVPFTSESKEAVSNYPEITKEVKLAIQECARSLQRYVGKKRRAEIESKKREIFKSYAKEVAKAVVSLNEKDAYKLSAEDLKEKSGPLLTKLNAIAETMYSTGKDLEELEDEIEHIEEDEEKEAKVEAEETELAEEREEEKEEFKEDEE
jgi:DNA topoisomerase VI subunit B